MLDQRLFRDGDLLCGKRAVRSVPEKAGRRKLLWRTDVCNGAAVAQSAAGGSFFRLYRAGGAVRRKRCAGAFLDSGNFSQASGVCTLDRHRSGAFGGQHPDRRSEKNGEGLYLPGSGDERAVPG